MSSADAFSLVDGGALCRVIRRLGLVRADGACAYFLVGVAALLVVWVPLVLLTLVHQIVAGAVPRLFEDWSVHARLLVAVPLFFRAEGSLHLRTMRCLDVLVSEGWVADDLHRVSRIVASTRRLRDAVWPELVLLGIALVLSHIALWDRGGPLAIARRLTIDREASAARYWYVVVSVPVFQFLLLRWAWRWALWTQLLWRVSYLRFAADHHPSGPGRRARAPHLAPRARRTDWDLAAVDAVD